MDSFWRIDSDKFFSALRTIRNHLNNTLRVNNEESGGLVKFNDDEGFFIHGQFCLDGNSQQFNLDCKYNLHDGAFRDGDWNIKPIFVADKVETTDDSDNELLKDTNLCEAYSQDPYAIELQKYDIVLVRKTIQQFQKYL